jgi:ion channel-forming bestrophin family protein
VVVGDKIPWLPVLRLHWRALALVFVVSLAVAAVHTFLDFRPTIAPLPFSVVGVALSIFLAFRNNAAYDRYWEGRKLWGGLVNASRSFGRQATTLVVAPEAEADLQRTLQRALVHRQIAYVNAVRAQLRGDDIAEEQRALLDADELRRVSALENPAIGLLQAQAGSLAAAAARGWLSDRRHLAMDATLTELTALQGGCERIKRTPIPLAYGFFARTFVRAFCVLLPLALVEQLGMATVLASLAVAFVFLVLDRIGDIIQDPFTTNFNGLPLASICRTIEVDLRRQLGETEVPPLLTPQPVQGGTARVLR